MKIFIAAAIVFGIAILAMAVGVIVSNRRLRGSCGGLAGLRDRDGKVTCDICSTPSEQCTGPQDAERRQHAQTHQSDDSDRSAHPVG